MAESVGAVKKEARSVLIDATAGRVNVTFSCLSLSEIRGLSLMTDSGNYNPTR